MLRPAKRRQLSVARFDVCSDAARGGYTQGDRTTGSIAAAAVTPPKDFEQRLIFAKGTHVAKRAKACPAWMPGLCGNAIVGRSTRDFAVIAQVTFLGREAKNETAKAITANGHVRMAANFANSVAQNKR